MSDERSVEESAGPSAELRVAFWTLVVLLDVAMLATALGVVLIVVEDRTGLGGALLAVGLLGFVECYRRVRARRKA